MDALFDSFDADGSAVLEMGELRPARKTLTQAAEEAAAQQTKVESGVKFLKRRADLTREALEASQQADEQEAELTRVAKAHPVETRFGAAVAQAGVGEVLKMFEKFGNDDGSHSVSKKNFRAAMSKLGTQVTVDDVAEAVAAADVARGRGVVCSGT